MTKDEIRIAIHKMCENAEKEIKEKRKAIITEQAYLRKHNYNLEEQALSYKDEAFFEADYILFQLKRKIFELFEEKSK